MGWKKSTLALVLSLVALGACAPGQSGANEKPDSPDSTISVDAATPASDNGFQAVTDPRDLFGQWRLVELTGAALPREPVITLLIGQSQIEARSQCIPFGPFSMDFRDDSVSIGVRAPLGRSARLDGVAPPAPVVCARTLSPVEELFPRVLLAATRVEQRPDNRVAFIGEHGVAVIARPDPPITNPFYNTPGPGPWLMWGEWQLASIDDRPLPETESVQLLFNDHHIEARSGCVSMLWEFEQNGAILSIGRESWPHPVCERARAPHEIVLNKIFAGDVRISRSTSRERLLVGRAGSVLLRR